MTRPRTAVVLASACVATMLLPVVPAAATPGPGQTVVPAAVITFPLAAAVAVLAALLLAVVAVLIVLRKRIGAGFAVLARRIDRLAEPARRRRLLAERRELGRRFATDGESVRRAYDTVGEAGGAPFAVRLDHSGAMLWVSPTDSMNKPWEQVSDTQWSRPTTALAAPGRTRPQRGPVDGCLVRAGTDAGGTPTFVDLSWLDGVLSIVGDQTVARDALQNVLGEVARLQPGLKLVVLQTSGAQPITIPPGLTLCPAPPKPSPPADTSTPVRGVAGRHPVGGLVIATGTPDASQKHALLAWCGRRGEGWTGLVCGDLGEGAHWRWDVDGDGQVDIPILGIKLTVPA